MRLNYHSKNTCWIRSWQFDDSEELGSETYSCGFAERLPAGASVITL